MSTEALYRLRDLSDLFVDACIRDEAGRLMFLSVFGRDTAIQQMYAAFQLPVAQGGLDVLYLEHAAAESGERQPQARVRAFISDADRFTKLSGRLPRCLFGQLVHTWIYDPVMIEPDKANGQGWVMIDKSPAVHGDSVNDASLRDKAREAVWTLLCHLSPIPLLPHWRDAVMTTMGGKLITDMANSSFPPIGRLAAAKVSISETFPADISAMVKAGKLTLEPMEKEVATPVNALPRTALAA